MLGNKQRAPRNRTITLTDEDRGVFGPRVQKLHNQINVEKIINTTICQDMLSVLDYLPDHSVDLVFADPPYNMNKAFNEVTFSEMSDSEYEKWLNQWVQKLSRILKPTGSLYLCGDWRSSSSLYRVLQNHFVIRNRITWEREKGRGANKNWKNASEDIWFCTKSDEYKFFVDRVKMKRRVIAPYTDSGGKPKDWQDENDGRFRLTHPSNLWTDLTVPFWSMPENTDHPTQKPEKLLAKIILASSDEGDVVLDPFVGSGTTSVVAKKLGRHYIGIDIDPDYCCLTEKRLELAQYDKQIQGYSDGVFWERNTLSEQQENPVRAVAENNEKSTLFG